MLVVIADKLVQAAPEWYEFEKPAGSGLLKHWLNLVGHA
jgi:hypothetical protein